MFVNERGHSGTVRLQVAEVVKEDEFKYFGSAVQSNGVCGSECRKRVQAGWSEWRKVAGVICDRRVEYLPAHRKGKLYKTLVRPAVL